MRKFKFTEAIRLGFSTAFRRCATSRSTQLALHVRVHGQQLANRGLAGPTISTAFGSIFVPVTFPQQTVWQAFFWFFSCQRRKMYFYFHFTKAIWIFVQIRFPSEKMHFYFHFRKTIWILYLFSQLDWLRVSHIQDEHLLQFLCADQEQGRQNTLEL